MSINIIERIFGSQQQEKHIDPDDKRPVKLVEDGHNSWRVVYAD